MYRYLVCLTLLGLVGCQSRGYVVLEGRSGPRAEARLSPHEARHIARANFPGARIEEVELEEEDGYLVYSFELRYRDGCELEVLIDAYTGDIVEVEEDDCDEYEDDDDHEDRHKPRGLQGNVFESLAGREDDAGNTLHGA